MLPLSTAETTPMRSCKGGGNTTESSASLRSRPCPGPLQRSMAAATPSVRAQEEQSTQKTASYSMATLYQHLMALPCSCSTYIHQNPIHVRDKLPAAGIPAKKTPAPHLLHRPNAPIRLGASSHSLLHLGKYFQWNMQTNQPWDHRQQLLLSAECRANQER